MSVYISDFGDGTTWTVTHDEAGHVGSISPSTVVHPVMPDGTENHTILLVTCPVCGTVSGHPAGGGAQPQSVQQMFVTHVDTNGCPCGQVATSDPAALGESHIRLLVNRMDGPGRWQLG